MSRVTSGIGRNNAVSCNDTTTCNATGDEWRVFWKLFLSFPDFGLQFLVILILHSLTSRLKGCRFPGKVYTILISLTSYWIRLLCIENDVKTRKSSGTPSDAVPFYLRYKSVVSPLILHRWERTWSEGIAKAERGQNEDRATDMAHR